MPAHKSALNTRPAQGVSARALTSAARWLAPAALLCVACAAAAANPADGVPIVTRHQTLIAGKKFAYTTEVGRIAIRDVETGEPHGHIFYTDYRVLSGGAAQGARAAGQRSGQAERPVMFLWNGGPGAPAIWVNFDLAGPKLLEGTHLIDNTDSWLAGADLVMVDPIGTGFSRPVRRRYLKEFDGTLGDVASVTEFVRCWLILHDDVGAPVYLAGESWGAGRAANVAYALEKRGIQVNGLVLISGGFGLDKFYGSATLSQAVGVVDMASTALYWHRSDPGLGRNVATIRRKAEKWVRRTYAPALAHIGQLSAAERNRIADELARFTGIAPELIDRRTLIISPHQFRTELLKGEGKVLYLLDGRRTSPPSSAGKAVILDYLRQTLGYRTDLPYLGLERLTQGFAPSGTYPRGVGEQWNYATGPVTPAEVRAVIKAAIASGAGPPQLGPPLPGTRETIALNPHLRVLVAVGMYDPYDQCARGQDTEDALPPELKRAITFKCYAGGHAMYLGSGSIRAELTHDVMALVKSAE
ncbi:MAG: S10 family serine carboxypeptidase-like protein [Steroidobacteraceae bacterium]